MPSGRPWEGKMYGEECRWNRGQSWGGGVGGVLNWGPPALLDIKRTLVVFKSIACDLGVVKWARRASARANGVQGGVVSNS